MKKILAVVAVIFILAIFGSDLQDICEPIAERIVVEAKVLGKQIINRTGDYAK